MCRLRDLKHAADFGEVFEGDQGLQEVEAQNSVEKIIEDLSGDDFGFRKDLGKGLRDLIVIDGGLLGDFNEAFRDWVAGVFFKLVI